MDQKPIGSLLLDLGTIENAPRFFALLSLVLRASGFTVVVMDANAERRGGEKVAAQHGIPLQEFHQWNGMGDVQAWKSTLASAYLDQEAGGSKVIWVDEQLGRWKGPSVDRPNLTCLNWRAVLEQGGVTAPAVQA